MVSSPPTCQPGCIGQPQCTIAGTDADLRTMIDGGPQAAVQIFMSGKLKITGDSMLISRLMRLLQMGNAPGF
jgi:putative sterol carrier protein